MKEFLKRTKFIPISIILLGVVIDLLVIPRIQCSPWWELLFHLGETFVIAGIVGLFLELTEFAEYFEKRLGTILVKEEFLDFFLPEKLNSISKAALRQKFRKLITNPKNRWEEYFSDVLEEVLPLFQKPYRANYRQVTHMKIVDVNVESAGSNNSSIKVSKMETIYEYDVISPSADVMKEYLVTTKVLLNRIPGIENLEEYYSVELTIDKKTESISPERTIQGDFVKAGFSHTLKFKGIAHVKIFVNEQERVGPANFISTKMGVLTHKATLSFSCEQPLTLDVTAFGLDLQDTQPDVKTPNAVAFIYSGWMFPGEGFFIDWAINSK